MKLVNEYRFKSEIAEVTYCKKESKEFTFYVSEYKTIWLITMQRKYHELPSVMDWRYSKKEFKTMENAINACIAEAIERKCI